MRKLLYLLPAICIIACSPRLRTVEYTSLSPLPDTAFVLVLEKEDRFSSGQKAGVLHSTDNTIAPACAYDDILLRMKQTARTRGANVIKITSYSTPDREHRCDQISAYLYKVDDPKAYERKFTWSPDRPLTWDDYKGNPNTIRQLNVGARTSCRFGIRVDTLHAPGKANVTVTSEFICYQSSVRDGQQSPSLLAHEQLHFDLCEAYARSLRKTLAIAALTPASATSISKEAFLQTYDLYREQQTLYDAETQHGLNADAQARWAKKISDALTALNAYAQ
ncbi:hypothetical protein [Chitinophaga agri]|uniref:DUF922 domain-containing protein n=1 Tax=Chitinophaga agri TaxID=2703787 RepID=A0A6B9ZMZ6_9BACT|nr:hypothetical protein [Chitinophaga agri]QHS63648.1 hypothetical protein GWR21_29925 [Chitinophaga agri]